MPAVTVSRVSISDCADLVAANLASREYHAPWAAPFTDAAGFDAWYGRGLTGANISFIAREQDTGGIVGVINISEICWGAFRSAYLGYYGMAQRSRRRLMTQAVRTVVQKAFEEIGLHRLEANIQPGNTASIALVRRIGFIREGFSPQYLKIGGNWCDHERWAIVDGSIIVA